MTDQDIKPPKGDKRRVRQSAKRAVYEQDAIKQVLDAALIGHVSFVHDGWPQSIPTAIARLGADLYLHGSRSSRLYKRQGDPVDDEEDLDLPHWAGEIPLYLVAGKPRDAENLPAGIKPGEALVDAMATLYAKP